MTTAVLSARPGAPLLGRIRVPGDKSISHRAMILGALAHGTTTVTGLLEGEDILATAKAMQAFGATVTRTGDGAWTIEGKGGFSTPADVIDCGNAGTGVRLIMGAAAGFPITATFTGDDSLRKRPMGRVLEPLSAMGARYEARDGGRLPLTLHGGALKGLTYTLPVASAQVKSAVLLAGLSAAEGVTVIEPEFTRDHTERMLKAFGAQVVIADREDGRHIRLPGGQSLSGTHVDVPGDPSSAAFPIVAGLIVPGSDLTITNEREAGGETVGDIVVRHSALTGVVVPPERAPSMIDEYPILAVAAAFATGETIMRGVGEMRVKESDRIALMAAGLQACGVEVDEESEGFIVRGTGQAPRGGGTVVTHGDHRIAMSHLILGLAAREPVRVDEPGMIATSFPTFVALMSGLGGDIQ